MLSICLIQSSFPKLFGDHLGKQGVSATGAGRLGEWLQEAKIQARIFFFKTAHADKKIKIETEVCPELEAKKLI